MENLSAKSKLIIAALALAMLSLLLLTVVTYWQFNEIIKDELLDAMSARTKESANHINTCLTGQLGEVRETVNSPIIDRVLKINPTLDLTQNDESIHLIDELNLARWKYVAADYPGQYAALHIINYLEKDEWKNPENLKMLKARYYNVNQGICRTDPWAKAAADEAGERYSKTQEVYDAIFKPAYSQAYGRNMILMLAWRKDAQGKVIAGAGASLTIETIQQIAQQATYGKKGYDILLAQDGTFVTHPNPAWAMVKKTSSVDDVNMKKLGELAAGANPGIFHFLDGGREKIAFYNPIPVSNWTLVSVVDESELFVTADKLRILMLAITAMIIIFTLIFVYTISLFINLKTESKIYQAEISALQAQIQPHFLYNTLNIIIALCRTNPKKAAEILEELSDYLQSKFRFSLRELIPLEQELELIKTYLAIEQVRFGKRLRVDFCIEKNSNPHIPPLILQPLVENAVKHGVCTNREGGTVLISVKQTEKETIIVINDDGVGMPSDKIQMLLNDKKAQEAGSGIQNINKRLKRHYGDGLEIQSDISQGTTVTVKIPFRKSGGENFFKENPSQTDILLLG